MRRTYRYDQELGRCVEVTRTDRAPGGPVIMVRPNIAYASPVDGRAVTTWAKRDYDLKASGCVPYETAKEMVQDARAGQKDPLDGLTLNEITRGNYV